MLPFASGKIFRNEKDDFIAVKSEVRLALERSSHHVKCFCASRTSLYLESKSGWQVMLIRFNFQAAWS